jgi:hypothetical protein
MSRATGSPVVQEEGAGIRKMMLWMKEEDEEEQERERRDRERREGREDREDREDREGRERDGIESENRRITSRL